MNKENETKRASSWWYLVPILFSILGGIIAYSAIRKEDQVKADGCLCIGVLMLIVNVIIFVSL